MKRFIQLFEETAAYYDLDDDTNTDFRKIKVGHKVQVETYSERGANVADAQDNVVDYIVTKVNGSKISLTPEADVKDSDGKSEGKDITIDLKKEDVELIPNTIDTAWSIKMKVGSKPLFKYNERIEKPAKKDVVKEDIDSEIAFSKTAVIAELDDLITEEKDFSKKSFYKVMKSNIEKLEDGIQCSTLIESLKEDSDLKKIATQGGFEVEKTIKYVCELI